MHCERQIDHLYLHLSRFSCICSCPCLASSCSREATMRRAGSFILNQTSKEVEDPRDSSDSNQNHIETRWNAMSAKWLFQQREERHPIYNKQPQTPRKSANKQHSSANNNRRKQKHNLIPVHISRHASKSSLLHQHKIQAFSLLSSHLTHTGSSLSPRRKYLPSSNSPPHSC